MASSAKLSVSETLKPKERSTKQREIILEVLQQNDRPLSPKEIFNGAKKKLKQLGFTTVYRAINHLTEGGFIEEVTVPGQPSRYELAGKHHHHHFLCRKCDKMFDLKGCTHAIERLAPKNFAVDDHHILLYGKCEQCA
jgi:Fur family ferric uptake transcriptional regulator